MQSDQQLVHAVVSGDHDAFADLVQRYEHAVRATVVQILADRHAAEDVAQDTFVKAFENLARLRDGSRFGSWLLKIAQRQALTRLRSRRVEIQLDLPQEIPDEQPNSRLDPQSAELLATVTRLPEHERRVIMLRHFDGHTVRSIAGITGRSVGTVTKQLTRAYRRLRNHLTKGRR